MKCKIYIKGAKEGGEILTYGDLIPSPVGFTVNYAIDGDECSVKYDGKLISQTRRGALDIDITFKKGKTTVCRLYSGELSGETPVFTNELDAAVTKDGARLYVDYLFCGEAVKLIFSAEYTKEHL